MSRPAGGRIAAWLDVRSGEERAVLLSFAGSFLAISFLVLGRALREALYLEAFDVRTLPYVTAAVALLSLPVVGRYAAWLARTPPRRVLRRLGFGLGLGLAAMAPFLLRSGVAIVAFYLWTALGALLLTSGFWVVVSEHFPVRGAKRLFGLIGAGGTLGALVTGTSVRWLAGRFEAGFLAPMLVALLALFLLAVSCLPPDPGRPGARAPDAASLTEGLALVRGSPHLRTIAAIVLTATIASTVLDYQFKEIVRSALQTKEELAGFFGAFYGWTGGAALVIQLLIAARLMARAGVARALAALPLFLLVGSSALFLLPGLAVATLARGGDNALRKSVFRSVLEFLWVPVPSGLRRRTKPILDTAVDSAAEGIGAVIVFLWVTLGGLPSRYLSAFVAGAALLFLGRARFMGRAYAATLRRRLLEEGEDIEHLLDEAGRGHRDLMSATFTRLDITRVLEARGIVPGRGGAEPGPTVSRSAPAVDPEAPKPDASLPADVPTLALALARDALAEAATSALARIGPAAVPDLAALLADEKADFVIRRRIPRALARIPDARADAALLAALGSRRFEVRYRAAAALVHRRSSGLP
ncbi:MAG: NTP/NDP exchange transporter, partial [Gemmatimonadota bacterium]